MTDVFTLPDVGEGLTEAEIVSWKVQTGDTVTVNQVLVEIETAKSLVELPSPQAGTIGALLVQEGQTVEVGTPIVRFGGTGGADDAPAAASGAGGQAGADAAAPAGGTAEEPDDAGGATLVGYGDRGGSGSRRRARRAPAAGSSAPAGQTTGVPADTTTATPAATSGAAPASAPPATPAGSPAAESGPVLASPGRPLAKPPVRKLAKDHGVDLARVPATGSRGEVTREDLLAYLDGAGGGGQAGAVAGSGPVAASSATAGTGQPERREERVPVKGVRKATAQAMVTSAFTAPHVTEFLEVDVTGTMDLVRHLKATGLLGEDVRVSPLLIAARAVCWAVRRNPMINATYADDAITIKHYVNLGIAAATPRGLLVPNIKDADRLDLAGLARELGQLIGQAREGKTPPSAQQGGTITITNVGVFGVDSGTPILNPGEAAILAFGQIRKKPWVVDDQIVPREVCQLAVSADHRVVDGETISKFLADVGAAMENPAVML
ncbi:dihydrolipoamide acetyltransferase family protein [Sediminivirga luteola]|uniref:Dihydrolipoamide acetyltransferase component of pyruvate dehydrogenase complex n=1 Tax=Sediminivirga luteola TaxID=1774748 RepID=A0A8J2U0K4_9MICO|nr:dihydrolipoamide acetyltransferase family protein [Sediminivirga luteola]MCI2264528.1 2-oxo acid dehydrogenase subunit E2 [Sediminivirga luteola]GGA25863.1 dihydrolipoamide acetyltransferase component of pyruvate dehydrogenase complex [Sediminivirga luteola]